MKTVLILVFFWASAMLGYGQEQVFDSVLKKGNASLVFDRPSADVGFCTGMAAQAGFLGFSLLILWVLYDYSGVFYTFVFRKLKLISRSFLYFCIPKIKAN